MNFTRNRGASVGFLKVFIVLAGVNIAQKLRIPALPWP